MLVVSGTQTRRKSEGGVWALGWALGTRLGTGHWALGWALGWAQCLIYHVANLESRIFSLHDFEVCTSTNQIAHFK